MASSIAPIRAFDYSKRSVKNMPLEQVQTRLLDDVAKIMWMAAPWRWTVGTLTAITLTSSTSDYTLAPPADFLYLMSAYISDGLNTPQHLEVVPSIPSNMAISGIPQFISYQGSNTFRISPKPGTLLASPTKTLVCYYKKIAPVISASNAYTATTLVFDDEWFPVFTDGVLWKSYAWGDDQRAGTCTVDSQGRIQFTGQRAVFEAGLAQMRQREPLPIYDHRVGQDQKEQA